ncbi:spondin domain-containing protein [Bowmanella dokdonensis]
MNISIRMSPLVLVLALSGCWLDDDKIEQVAEPEPVMVRYEVTVTNLTAGQPISPLALLLHESGRLWEVGQSASVALEQVAEEGNNQAMLATERVLASSAGESPILPGQSETLSISIEEKTDSLLSIAAMLGNTNDGFTGLNALDLAQLSEGDSWEGNSFAYDAGTEANSESLHTVPGPAAGGEGFNGARDDRDFISMHPGVVSAPDGLPDSALTVAQRFDNPVARIRITRTQ